MYYFNFFSLSNRLLQHFGGLEVFSSYIGNIKLTPTKIGKKETIPKGLAEVNMVRIYENDNLKSIGQLLLFVFRINRCFLASFMTCKEN